MARIKFTKNELKSQKDALKRYLRYLPTLLLKKQQLQIVIRRVEAQKAEIEERKKGLDQQIRQWIQVFGEGYPVDSLLSVESVTTDTGNIAGVDIPVFKDIRFRHEAYDFFATPLWVDTAVEKLEELIRLDEELAILNRQVELLEQELRVTSQRVNLFEKVKIPEAREYIRIIRIYLGDQQTAAVVRGKISKSNIVRSTGQ
ncbi:MAG: V-type ATP synthase subunit D [Spirochaetales bacterium]|nr:MAG: V-type ATP synthase subunit D [Spirochaetales bacterium]